MEYIEKELMNLIASVAGLNAAAMDEAQKRQARLAKCDNEANIAPGGKSGNIMKARVIAAFNRLIQNGGDVLIVTHGGPIAAIIENFFSIEYKNRYEWQPQPGRGYLLEFVKIYAAGIKLYIIRSQVN